MFDVTSGDAVLLQVLAAQPGGPATAGTLQLFVAYTDVDSNGNSIPDCEEQLISLDLKVAAGATTSCTLDQINVAAGSQVTYCWKVSNLTRTYNFTTHS